MWGGIVDLIIQLIAGGVGGNIAGSALKQYDLGAIGNTIAGVVGGGVGGLELFAHGRVRRAYIGVSGATVPVATRVVRHFGLPSNKAVHVLELVPGSPAPMRSASSAALS